MDRNSIIGIVLIFLLITTWTYFNQDTERELMKEREKIARQADSTQSAAGDSLANGPDTAAGADSLPPLPSPEAGVQGVQSAGADEAELEKPDSLAEMDSLARIRELRDTYGYFWRLTQKPADDTTRSLAPLTVETPLTTYTIQRKGGVLRPVRLNAYETYQGEPQPIISNLGLNTQAFEFVHQRRTLRTDSLYFEPMGARELQVARGDTQQVVLRAALNQERYLELVYTFYGNRYQVDQELRLVGLRDLIQNTQVDLSLSQVIPVTEKSKEKMKPLVNALYNYQGDIEELDARSDDPDAAEEIGKIDWLAFRSQFFSHAVIPLTEFERVSIASQPLRAPDVVKGLNAVVSLPYGQALNDTFRLRHYMGPNDYYVLKKYDNDLEELVDLGWGPIHYINAWIILPVFQQLSKVVPSYGAIIFILALLIKLLLSPLTLRSYLSTAKMQVMNEMPEIKELDEKFKDNPTKLQTEKMAIYNQAGVSPLGGCLPLLLQFPILIAMFTFFPASIELRQKSFLWADDLSTYDSILDFGYIPIISSVYGEHVSGFTLLMTITTLIYTYLTQQTQVNNPAAAQFKYIAYLFPLVFMGILNQYAAALSYYYFTTNLLTIAQMLIMKRMVNKDKLHEKLQEKRKARAKKGGGKSRMQRWLEEQQKKQQQMQKQQGRKKK